MANRNTIAYNLDTGSDTLCSIYLQKTLSFESNNIYYSSNCDSTLYLLYDDFNGSAINAGQCYWKKYENAQIEEVVWDYFDDQNLAIVDYTGFAFLPDTSAPITPVENLVKTAVGGGVQLDWSANLETDLAGYRVYWGSPTGFSFANSVDIGNSLTYTISGIGLTDTIAVTAYDLSADGVDDQVQGHESWYGGYSSSQAVLAPTIVLEGLNLLSSTEASEYQWYMNNAPVDEATGQTYLALTPGHYFVVVTDTLGCQSVSNLISFAMSISEEMRVDFKVYPNPSTGTFTVEGTALEQADRSIKVFDMQGRTITQVPMNHDKAQLDLSTNGPGIYLLMVMDAGAVLYTRKVVVQ